MRTTQKPNPGLNVEVYANALELSRAAAARIVSALRKKPDLLLCASAGGTPTGTYEELAVEHLKRPRLFSRMRVLQIDEWGGLDADSPATCAADLRRKLLTPLDIPDRRFFAFHTDACDSDEECRRMADRLETDGPIDICILGLGLNGHIAMNEPGDCLTPGVHRAKLTAGSRQHPMLRRLRRKPHYGYTLGLGDILKSREVLLLVSGRHKRPVMRKLLSPRVTTALPASFLWVHGNGRVLCDADAAVAPWKGRSRERMTAIGFQPGHSSA